APGSPAGMTLEQDLSFWTLAWAPDNDDVVNAPTAGHTLYLQFQDPSGAPVGDPQAYPVGVAPLYNDTPSFGDLSGLDLSLSAGPFERRQLAFDFVDPGQATGRPSCTLEVFPVGVGSCPSAWSETRCEGARPREGETWPFV